MSLAKKIHLQPDEIISEPAEPKKIIFVIDDDSNTRAEIIGSLRATYDVVALDTPSDIISRTTSSHPYAILLDVNMPNIDGYEVLSLLKNNPNTSSTPVLCMSSHENETLRRRIDQLGASGFIRKPIDKTRLAEDVTTLVHSLNRSIISMDGSRTFTICYNENEKQRLIKKLIQTASASDETLLFLSWTSGSEFFLNETSPLIECGKLVFLEIKPSLIIKFPYIQEVSPLIHDLQSFMTDKDKKYHLIFDEIRNVLNVYDPARSLSKTYALATILRTLFQKTSLFSTKPSQNEGHLFLQKMAKIFTSGTND